MRTAPNASERAAAVAYAAELEADTGVSVDGAPIEAGSRLLTVLEVAGRLRCSRTTVFGLIRDGDLPSVKPGRERLVAARDVDEYLERERTAAR